MVMMMMVIKLCGTTCPESGQVSNEQNHFHKKMNQNQI